MVIFHSYVSLPEGKLPELADIPHVWWYLQGSGWIPIGHGGHVFQVAPERKDVRDCAEAWRKRRNVLLSLLQDSSCVSWKCEERTYIYIHM